MLKANGINCEEIHVYNTTSLDLEANLCQINKTVFSEENRNKWYQWYAF